MHSRIIYLFCGFLVCGIIFNFQNTPAQISSQTVSLKTEQGETLTIPCSNQNLRLVWNEIKGEFKDDSSEGFSAFGIKSCADMFQVEKVVDLNGDRQPEIIVHQMAECPASGNCTFWVFQKKKNVYQAILNANEIQLFQLGKSVTKGYSDIRLQTQNSAGSYYIQVFKFNGSKYTARRCWWEDYTFFDRRGDLHRLKKPRIRFEKCGEYDYVN